MKPAPARYSLPSLRIIAIGWACLLLSCEGSPPSHPTASTIQKSVGGTAPAAPKVMYRGCRVVQKTRDGLLCLQSATSRTVLWVENTPCEQLEVRDNNQPVAVDASYVEGGCQLKQKEPSKPPRSTLSIHNKDTGTSFWSLQTDRSKPWLMEWTDRMWRRATPDLAGVDSELAAQFTQQAEPLIQIDLAYAQAVVFLRQGEISRSIGELFKTTELARVAGYPSIAFEAAHRRMTLLRQASSVDEAALVLKETAPLLTIGQYTDELNWPWDQSQILYYHGMIAEAEPLMRGAINVAQRFDDSRVLLSGLPLWADMLRALNRTDDSYAALELIIPHEKDVSGCVKTGLLANKGWLILQLAQGASSFEESQSRLNASMKLLGDAQNSLTTCPDNTLRANILSGIAHTAVMDNNVETAKATLRDAHRLPGVSLIDQMEMLELEAKIANIEHQPKEALRLLGQLALLSQNNPTQRRELTICRIAVATLEAKKALGADVSSMMPEIKNCIGATSKLEPFEQGLFKTRLKTIGIEQ